MIGSKIYYEYRASLEEIQFLAATVPAFLEHQKDIMSNMINKYDRGPDHPVYKEKKTFDVYLEKDYESIMAKQLLYTLFTRFEILIAELIEQFSICNTTNQVERKERETIKDKLNVLLKLCPIKLRHKIKIDVFDTIDYYYVIRNLFIHNDGIIN